MEIVSSWSWNFVSKGLWRICWWSCLKMKTWMIFSCCIMHRLLLVSNSCMKRIFCIGISNLPIFLSRTMLLKLLILEPLSSNKENNLELWLEHHCFHHHNCWKFLYLLKVNKIRLLSRHTLRKVTYGLLGWFSTWCSTTKRLQTSKVKDCEKAYPGLENTQVKC